jgi:simple sugar transport system substrate-binding protein
MRTNTILGIGLCTALGVVGCSRSDDSDASGSTGKTAAALPGEKPAPFDKGPVKIALIQHSGSGDYFKQWTTGARQQGDAVGFAMQIYDAEADNAKQAADMKAAIGSGVAGIIVDHGQAETMCPLINQATGAGLPVVVYDIEVTKCAPNAVETEQNDADLATLVLTQMAEDLEDGIPVGYVNVRGIAPFDRRDAVWQKFVTKHKWDQKFLVGRFTHAVATDNARLVDAALKRNPDVKAIFAPYDELTKGTVSAIEQHGLQTKVAAYGIDISDADIALMTKKDSPWKATATADPRAVGAAVVRTMALEVAGKLGSKEVVFPGVLVTRSFLLDHQIGNMDDLRAKLPDLNLAEVSSADWIPAGF